MLKPMPVAEFYADVMIALEELGIAVTISTMPCEIADCIPFDRDTKHSSYDADYANRFWRVLARAHDVMAHFRTGFLGKSSPVHFFWGSFDLAVTRFSGRRAPRHPGGVPHLPDSVAREAYSHEVSSAGFWPGGGADRLSGVLFLRLSGAGRFQRGGGHAGRGVFLKPNSANSFIPTTPCAWRAIPTPR